MNILLDTNILIYLARDNSLKMFQQVNPEKSKIFISVCTIAELRSIALQNNWGQRKIALTEAMLDEMIIVEINENLIDAYAQIDAFSQCKNQSFDIINI